MSCLACGSTTVAEEWASSHELADSLCLACLLVVIQSPDNRGLSAAPDFWRCRGVRDRACSGLKGTCPGKAVRHGINGSWCATCAPPEPPPILPPISRATDRADDDGMDQALLAVLDVFSVTILRIDPHPYGAPDDLEGSWDEARP